jgi:hypothetical protein
MLIVQSMKTSSEQCRIKVHSSSSTSQPLAIKNHVRPRRITSQRTPSVSFFAKGALMGHRAQTGGHSGRRQDVHGRDARCFAGREDATCEEVSEDSSADIDEGTGEYRKVQRESFFWN